MKRIVLICVCLILLLPSCIKKESLLTVSQSSISAPGEGIETSITVTSTYAWEVENQCSDWVTIKSPSGMEIEKTVTITVAPNPKSEPRSGSLIFTMRDKTATVTINQESGETVKVLTGDFNLTSEAQNIEVKVEYNVDYTVYIMNDWIHHVETKDNKTDVFTFHIDQNTSTKTREGSLEILKDGAPKSETMTIKIVQAGAIFGFKGETNFNLTYKKQQLQVELAHDMDFSINQSGVPSWIKIQTQKKDNKTTIFKIDVAENNYGSVREADIIAFSGSQNRDTLHIIQNYKPTLTFENENDTLRITNKAQNLELYVRHNVDFYLNKNILPDWITSETVKIDNNRSKVTLSVSEYTEEETRSAQIIIKENDGDMADTLILIQEAVSVTNNLPSGKEFNRILNSYLSSNPGITRIIFVANSNQKSNAMLTDDIYFIKKSNTLEIHTSQEEYVVGQDCKNMFDAQNNNNISNIEYIDLGNDFNTSSVKDMSYMFSSCTNLKYLNLGEKFITQNVSSMQCLFLNCKKLEGLNLESFIFNNTDISNMFMNIGAEAPNKPIQIYVTEEGKKYIETAGNSYINNAYAKLVVNSGAGFEVPDGGINEDEGWF